MSSRILFALALLSVTACSDSETGTAPTKSVVLICIDTLRADHLGCYGYPRPTTPALDALAQESLLFENASAAAGWTKPSVPSFLTGTFPLQHGVYEGSARRQGGESSDVLPERTTTLAEAFAEAGYTTAAFVRNAQLRRGLGFEQGFETYVDEAGDAAEIRQQAERWLAERDGEEPFFLYLHFLDAHWPYPIPDEAATRFAEAAAVAPFRGKSSRALLEAINDGERELSSRELDGLLAVYDGAIRYVDDELGQLFDGLRTQGTFEDLVVCVVSDHGEEFLEHGRIGHGHGLWEGLLRVPWILRAPTLAAGRIEGPVSLVDLFPTLLSAAGLADTATHVGLDRISNPHRLRPVFAEHKGPRHYQQAWRDGPNKAIRTLKPAEPEGAVPDPSSVFTDGSRWEVELSRADAASEDWRVVELQPSEDELDDPFEIKGPVRALDGTAFTVLDLKLQLTPDVEFYGDCEGDEPASDLLRPDRWIKAKVELSGGERICRRVKIYESVQAGTRPEIRGIVTDVERDEAGRGGKFSICGLELRWDDATDWDVDKDDLPRWRLERDRVHELVRALAAGEELDLTRDELLAFDLSLDPDEQAAIQAPEVDLEAWYSFASSLTQSTSFSASDREELDAETLEALKAIGYVD